MKETRIVKREYPDGRITFTIQQKHWIFFWSWVDAWLNSTAGASCQDSFESLEEAERNLCYFDGSKRKETVI